MKSAQQSAPEFKRSCLPWYNPVHIYHIYLVHLSRYPPKNRTYLLIISILTYSSSEYCSTWWLDMIGIMLQMPTGPTVHNRTPWGPLGPLPSEVQRLCSAFKPGVQRLNMLSVLSVENSGRRAGDSWVLQAKFASKMVIVHQKWYHKWPNVRLFLAIPVSG